MTKYFPGHKFGQLTLIEIDRTRYRATVECECGIRKEFQMSNLIAGKTTNCGCDRENNGEEWMKDKKEKNRLEKEKDKGKDKGQLQSPKPLDLKIWGG